MNLFNLGTADTSNSLGISPTGLYSGVNPVAGMPGASAATPMPKALQMMILQQALAGGSQLGQNAQIQSNNFQPYADPAASVTPAMLGRQIMGA